MAKKAKSVKAAKAAKPKGKKSLKPFGKKKAPPSSPTRIVFDEWDTYFAERDGVAMCISFDDQLTQGKPPSDLKLCARILIPIQSPGNSGGPTSPESELLYDMEDELCAMLKRHKAQCRLAARLTYGPWRELVFQVKNWGSFRAPVGLWIMKHPQYAIDVSEHRGWTFFNDFVRPTPEDRMAMADRRVIDALIESGSNPKRKHVLDFAFEGGADALKKIVLALSKRGFKALSPPDFASGTVEIALKTPLDLAAISKETLHAEQLATKLGAEFLGWGAAIVE